MLYGIKGHIGKWVLQNCPSSKPRQLVWHQRLVKYQVSHQLHSHLLKNICIYHEQCVCAAAIWGTKLIHQKKSYDIQRVMSFINITPEIDVSTSVKTTNPHDTQ